MGREVTAVIRNLIPQAGRYLWIRFNRDPGRVSDEQDLFKKGRPRVEDHSPGIGPTALHRTAA